jgi:tRNA (guanine37-N1)-methyltransferase
VLRFDLLTIFPEFFGAPEPASGILGHGVLRRAIRAGLITVGVEDLRAHTDDRHRTVDDRPFGGGEGMVLKPEPVARAVAALDIAPKPKRDSRRTAVLLLSAAGRPFRQTVARELSTLERVVLICGRYEGVDERISTHIADGELSVGDYVLSGGELAAALVLDAVARLVPGVLGNAASSQFESFGADDADLAEEQTDAGLPRATYGTGGLLDYPHYTRPAVWQGVPVPEVLLGGDHEQIRQWRRERSLEKTWRHRPELLREALADGRLSAAEQRVVERLESSGSSDGTHG